MPDLNVPTLTGGNMAEIARIGFGGFDPSTLDEQLLDHWNVKEDVREAFAKAVFSSQLFGTDVTGNVGVRLVNTKTTSEGFDSVGSTIQPSTGSKEYTDVLPSATLNFLIDDQRILRFAVAKVIARPPLDELRTGRRLDDPSVTVGQLTGSGGNPQLDPFKATQVDVSYEWYFHTEALAALAVYRKEVDSSIGYRTDREVINGLDYLVSAPFNGGGGYINGVELTFQTPFYFIPHMENFGVYSNYSLVDSNLKEFSPEDNPLPLSGLARKTGTFDLWYSSGTFEARVGYKYHSPYTVVYGWNAARLARLQSEGTVDLSLNWQYSKQLGFRFQASTTNERCAPTPTTSPIAWPIRTMAATRYSVVVTSWKQPTSSRHCSIGCTCCCAADLIAAHLHNTAAAVWNPICKPRLILHSGPRSSTAACGMLSPAPRCPCRGIACAHHAVSGRPRSWRWPFPPSHTPPRLPPRCISARTCPTSTRWKNAACNTARTAWSPIHSNSSTPTAPIWCAYACGTMRAGPSTATCPT